MITYVPTKQSTAEIHNTQLSGIRIAQSFSSPMSDTELYNIKYVPIPHTNPKMSRPLHFLLK